MAHPLPPTNLPVQLTSFVGRERGLDELAGLLQRSRLVTVAGPAGLGKTRRPPGLAARVLAECPEGVWLGAMAALSAPADVPREVAATLGVREPFGQSEVASLAAHVGGRRLLLVLDDCEHLLDACARL